MLPGLEASLYVTRIHEPNNQGTTHHSPRRTPGKKAGDSPVRNFFFTHMDSHVHTPVVEKSSLDWPDKHHFDATTGWLMLGNPREARVEFEQISSAARRTVDVLDVEWRLLADEKRWEEAVAVADNQVSMAPQHVAGWIHRSFALHELRRTESARDLLLPAVKLFAKETTIPYNLACYECQLGNLNAARDWLRRTLSRHKSADGRREQLAMALTDPDLQPLADGISRGEFDT